MKQNSKQKLIPKLRFPEFRDEPGWEATPLNEVLTEHGSKSDGHARVHSVSMRDGVIDQISHLGRSFAASDTSRYPLAKPDDIIYTKSPLKEFPYGIVKRNQNASSVIVSPLYGVFSPANQWLSRLIDAYFESPARANSYLAPIVQKGAKNTLQITNDKFISQRLYLPCNEAEQRKIADCLSSLDEVIAAQAQKVESLKAQKQALMQEIFPREDEAVPRLRFPEFRDAPDWQESEVRELISTIVAPKKIQTSLYLVEGQFPIVDQSQSFICGWTNDVEAVLSIDVPLIVFGDHTCVLKLVKQPFAQGADGIKILSANSQVDVEFLYYALQNRPLTSAAYQRHFSLLQAKTVRYPGIETGEQKMIAGILSSIDDLISAYTEQFEALKNLKAGLMQQLFPSPEEPEA